MDKNKLAIFFLRIGIAFAFFYVAIFSFLNPTSWIGFIPKFVELFVPAQIFLYGHAAFDMLLGIWLLTNRKIFYAAILSALTMFGIIIFNLSAMDIIFRDVAIFFSAISLALLTRKRS